MMANKPLTIALASIVILASLGIVVWTVMPRSYAPATTPSSSELESRDPAATQALQQQQSRESGSGTEAEGTRSR